MQGEGDDHGAFLLTNGRWMQEPVGFRSPLVARATGGGGGRGGPRPPRGGAQPCFVANGETNLAERNIAWRQPVTPAPAAWGFCHGSRFVQKYCLRFAFTNDSDMESGNGRVPESGVTSPIICLYAAGHRHLTDDATRARSSHRGESASTLAHSAGALAGGRRCVGRQTEGGIAACADIGSSAPAPIRPGAPGAGPTGRAPAPALCPPRCCARPASHAGSAPGTHLFRSADESPAARPAATPTGRRHGCWRP